MEDNQEKYTFEMLMQAFKEERESFKEMRELIKEQSLDFYKRLKESDKSMKELRESQKETDRIIKSMSKSTDEKIAKNVEAIKETNKQIFGISQSNGDVAEDTIYNALEQDMTFAGMQFDFIDRNWKRKSKSLKLEGEFDVILENGNTVALIETKYKVRKEDVEKLFAKASAGKFRKLFPLYDNHKIILGVGGMSFDDDAIQEAKENGVGIIKIVGDKVEYHTEGIKIY